MDKPDVILKNRRIKKSINQKTNVYVYTHKQVVSAGETRPM